MSSMRHVILLIIVILLIVVIIHTEVDLPAMTLVMMSTGTGKMIVLLFSAEMLFNV